VGDPGAAVTELWRVTAEGGSVAVSLWPPPQAGAAQRPEMVARIKAEYERIMSSYLDGAGRLALSLEALPGVGHRKV